MPTKRLLILSMALIGAIIATTSFTTPPFPNPVVVSGTGDQSAWAAYRAGERAQLSASNFDPASQVYWIEDRSSPVNAVQSAAFAAYGDGERSAADASRMAWQLYRGGERGQ